MTRPDPRWRSIPVLRELHDQWWRARGGRLGQSSRPFSRDWNQLLEDAGLVSAELRAEAERDARMLAASDLLQLKAPRLRPHLLERILVPVTSELHLAELFGDPVEPAQPGPDLDGIPWEPELEFVRRERVGVAAEDILALNRFLAGGGRGRPLVPIKERSLQIFGDEKRLDALLVTALFRPDRLSLPALRCHLVPEPLGWRRGPHPAGPIVVLENAATWDSFARWNESAKRFSAVVYGKGLVFAESVTSLADIFRELGGPRRVEYFGDLDPPGIEIPWRAHRRADASGLPAILPQAWSYQRLLELGTGLETTWEGDPVHEEAMTWLGDLATPVRDLFTRKQRLAQEHLGWEVLSTAPPPPTGLP